MTIAALDNRIKQLETTLVDNTSRVNELENSLNRHMVREEQQAAEIVNSINAMLSRMDCIFNKVDVL